MRELTIEQGAAVGGGFPIWLAITVASAVIDFAQGFNDAYNAANVQK